MDIKINLLTFFMQHLILRIEYKVSRMPAANFVEAAQVDQFFDILIGNIEASSNNQRIDGGFSPDSTLSIR